MRKMWGRTSHRQTRAADAEEIDDADLDDIASDDEELQQEYDEAEDDESGFVEAANTRKRGNRVVIPKKTDTNGHATEENGICR